MKKVNQENTPDASVSQLADLSRWTSICSKALSQFFANELAEHEISLNEFILLYACRQNHERGLSQHELAALTGCSSAQLSQIAEQLRQKGWIVSARCQRDRRRQTLSLAPAGADALREASTSLREPTRKLVRDSGSWLHTDVVEFLRQMVRSIEKSSRVPQELSPTRSTAFDREAA